MSDRFADGDICLDKLDIEGKKRLKCYAHPILAIDNAINTTLRGVESTVGRVKLEDKCIGPNLFQCKTSIVKLSLIAIVKCTSHAALTYSLYTQYKNWMRDERLTI